MVPCFWSTRDAKKPRPTRNFVTQAHQQGNCALLELRLKFSSTRVRTKHKEPLPTTARAPSHHTMASCTLANRGAHPARRSIGTPDLSGLAGNAHTHTHTLFLSLALQSLSSVAKETSERRCYFGAPPPHSGNEWSPRHSASGGGISLWKAERVRLCKHLHACKLIAHQWTQWVRW